MSRPLKLPERFHEHDFLLKSKKESNGRNRIRLLAMHHVQSGESLKEIGPLVGVHWKTVQSWLRRFREEGFSGLFESPRSGAPKKITGKAAEWLSKKIHTLSTAKTGGSMTGKELLELLFQKYSISCSLKTVYNKLHELNYSWITCRSMHPKSDKAVQADYKKKLPEIIKNVVTQESRMESG